MLPRVALISTLLGLLTTTAGAEAVREYGPVKPGDNLWTIASRMRQDQSTSISETIQLLYKENPQAFIDNDIHQLRTGVWLRLPAPAAPGTQAPLLATDRGQSPTESQAVPPPGQALRQEGDALFSPDQGRPESPSFEQEIAAGDAGPHPLADAVGTTKENSLPAQELEPGTPFPAEPIRSPRGTPALEPAQEAAGLAGKGDPLPATVPDPMTAESSAAQSPAPEERDSRAMIAIAGIGAGGAILLALVALATVVLRRSRRSVKTAEALVPLPDTESLEALLARAGRETASGNYNLARVLLRQAIARAPQDSAVRLHLLEVEFAQKDGPSFAADAAELQEMLQGSDPELWEKVAAMGLILCPDQPLFRGKEAEVAGPQEIEERIPAFEESAEMLVARADQEATAGNHNLARAILRRAISRQPRNPEIRLKLLKIEYSQKDGLSFAADAEELWTLPDIEESPLWEQVHQMGRELCPEQPLFRESLEGEVPAPAPAPRAHAESLEELLLRADQEATAGNYNLARAILRQAITRDPGDPELRVKLLTVEYAQKDGPSFTADAEELRTVLKSGESGIWEKVAAMGRALRPDQPLFQ